MMAPMTMAVMIPVIVIAFSRLLVRAAPSRSPCAHWVARCDRRSHPVQPQS